MKISNLDYHLAGFSNFHDLKEKGLLDFHLKMSPFQTGHLGDETCTHYARVPESLVTFELIGDELDLVQMEAAISEVRHNLQQRSFEPKGELQFTLYVVKGDDRHFHVAAEDCFEAPWVN